MNLKKYIPLLEKTSLANFNYGRKVGELGNDQDVFKHIFDSVRDGTIDPGDSEDATKRMGQILTEMPEYKVMMEVHRANRKPLAEMYQDLSKASEAEFMEYIEALQSIATKIGVDQVLKLLHQKGIIKDNR